MLDSLTSREKVQAIYLVYLASFVLAPLSFVGVFFAYKLRRECHGTWLESHCNWQIQTFWISFGAFVAGVILTFLFIGVAVMVVASLWFLYRVIKGWIKLSENQVVEPRAFGLV